MTAALAYKIEEIEADASLVACATKECFDCDPDNPRAVPRDECKSCGGSGRQKLAAAEIALELEAARSEADAPSRGDRDAEQGEGDVDACGDDDLYLEY